MRAWRRRDRVPSVVLLLTRRRGAIGYGPAAVVLHLLGELLLQVALLQAEVLLQLLKLLLAEWRHGARGWLLLVGGREWLLSGDGRR